MDLISEDSKEEEEVDFEDSETSIRFDSQGYILFEPYDDIELLAATSSSNSMNPALFSLPNPTSTPLSTTPTTLTTMSGITGSSGSSGGSGGPTASSPSSSASSSTKPPLPRVGGHIQLGSEWIPFSGGGLHDANRKDRPFAAPAFRPTTDLRSLMRVEESSSKPLEEPKRIDEGHRLLLSLTGSTTFNVTSATLVWTVYPMSSSQLSLCPLCRALMELQQV